MRAERKSERRDGERPRLQQALDRRNATRTPFDRLAKETWSAILERAGRAETQTEVARNALFVDLTFEPDEAKLDALAPFGIVERMMSDGAPSLVEFFHGAPSMENVIDCMQKLFEQRRRGRKRRSKNANAPRLWIVAARRPSRALEQLGSVIASDWPTGTYRLAEGFRTYVIAVNELPVQRDTLLLRVLGAGHVLRAALAEVGALPHDAPERGILSSTVLRLRRDTQSAKRRTPTDEEFLMTTQDLVQQWERELLEQGLKRGREEGRLEERAEDVLRVLAARKLSISKGDRERVLACKDLEQLGRWLERAVTAASTSEIFDDGRKAPVTRRRPR